MAVRKPQAAHLLAAPDEVEAQFYEALREANLERLMAIWHDDDDVVCVHPGGPRVVGAAAIRASFEAMFANGSIAIQPQKVRRVHTLDSAVHSVVERITVQSAQGTQIGHVVATNVYVKTAQGWRMVIHHASPGTQDEVAEVVEAPSVLH